MQNRDYCYIEIPKEDNKISKYNHGGKSVKVPFIIYATKTKEMIPLTTEKKNHIMNIFVIYAKKNLVPMAMTIEMYSNYTIEYEIIVIIVENIEELLMVFVI